MADVGLSIGSIAGIGAGMGIGSGPVAVAATQSELSATVKVGDPGADGQSDVVVTISNAATHALAIDARHVDGVDSISRLADDLAALALLEILARRHRNDGEITAVTAALQLYLAIQALGR